MTGRDYLVAPVTTIVPGVLIGNAGAGYYSSEECARNPSDWNGVPLLTYHPLNGSPTAKTYEVLNSQWIGILLNSVYDDNLKGEAWFDVELTNRVDSRITAALEAGTPLELSTGLFGVLEQAEEGAIHNGIPYDFTVKDFKPDHLAILVDQVGACSLNDGCGVLINQARISPMDWLPANQVKDCTCNGTNLAALFNAEMSLTDRMMEIERAFRLAHPVSYDPKTGYSIDRCFLVTIFDGYVIYYRYDRESYHETLYRQSYTMTGMSVTFDSESEEVKQVVSYEPVMNQYADSPNIHWQTA